MLTLYAVFILALSSSVIAPPPPRPHDVYKELINTALSDEDQVLIKGVWGRAVPQAPWTNLPDWHGKVLNAPEDGEDHPSTHIVDWAYACNCDDFIRFYGKTQQGVTKVIALTVHRVKRKIGRLGESRRYEVAHTNGKNAWLVRVYAEVPQAEWGKFLHGTQWVREPNIVGPERSGGDKTDSIRFSFGNENRLYWALVKRDDSVLGAQKMYNLPGTKFPEPNDVYARDIPGLGPTVKPG